MKIKILMALILGIFISDYVTGQNTSANQKLTENETYHITSPSNQNKKVAGGNFETNNHIYRDTRLGSSSPLYDTYQKNNSGAGSITTNPNKGGVDGSYTPSPTYPINEIHMDTSTNSHAPDTLYNKNNSNQHP